jgi:hypothetical protein
VIGDEDALAEFVFKSPHFNLKILDGDWVDAAEGFVEENELWIGDERAGDFKLSAFAAAEGVGFLVSLAGETVLVEEGFGSLDALPPGKVEGFKDSQEILKDGEPAEIASFLGEISDSEPGAFEHGEEGDIDGIEGHRAAVRLNHAENHAESGGFPGPVAAEEPDDLALA